MTEAALETLVVMVGSRHFRGVLARTPYSVLTNDDLRSITRPCVYLFVKNGQVLYIGKGANGLLRVADPGHHRAKVRANADEIRVLWFENDRIAEKVEQRLIQELQPPYNEQGKAVTSCTADIEFGGIAA